MKEDIPAISVIVPVHNGQEFFKTTLDLLRRQTLSNIELIFVDDCGEDFAFERAEEAAKEDNRVVLIRNHENRGPGYSRNQGIAAARGEYVAFVDCDDVIPLDYFERLYVRAKETGALIVKGGRADLYEDGHVVISSHSNDIKNKLKQGIHLLHSFGWEHTTAIYQRQHVIKNGARNADATQDEDTAFIMKCVHNVTPQQFSIVDDLLYYYRKHSASITHQVDSSYLKELMKSLVDKLDYITKQPYNDDLGKHAANQLENRANARFSRAEHSPYVTLNDKVEYLNKLHSVIVEYKAKLPKLSLYGQSAIIARDNFSAEAYISNKNEVQRSQPLKKAEANPQPPKKVEPGNQSSQIDAQNAAIKQLQLAIMEQRVKRQYLKLRLKLAFSFGKKKKKLKEKVRAHKGYLYECRYARKEIVRKLSLNF